MSRDLAPDRILRQALEAQHKANMDWRPPEGSPAHHYSNGVSSPSSTMAGAESGLTLTVLGCGTMGIAILGGVMDSLASQHPQDHVSIPTKSVSGTSTPAEPTPERLPTKFNACVRRHESAKRIRNELGKYPAFDKTVIYENDNLGPVTEADVIHANKRDLNRIFRVC